jgi:hypothetical protein
MKRKTLWFLPIFIIGAVYAGRTYSALVINKPCAAVDFTETIDLEDWSRFSLQAIYSDGTPSADTVSDGNVAYTSITITNYDSLNSEYASVQVNVATITAITGESVTLNGIVYTAGTNFTVGASSSTTATNLAAAIAANNNFTATASGSTVTVKASAKGTTANSWTATTSDSDILDVSAATFSSGVVETTIDIGGLYTLTEGVDWDAATSNAVTAKNISDAIMANSTLNAVIKSTHSGDVVYSTAVVPGSAYNYYVTISTTAFTVENGKFTNGSDSEVLANIFTESAHGFTTGLPILFGVGSGTAPQNLVDGTTYYAIKLNGNRYSLATSSTNAVAGTAITISTFTGGGSFTLTPLSLSGTPSFKWEGSNDNSNWASLQTTIASVTYSAAGNTLWDVGEVGYRYLRINYTAPTYSGLNLQVYMAGKKD